MKQFALYIKEFVQEDYDLKTYAASITLLGGMIVLNDHFRLETQLINGRNNNLEEFLLYLFLYSFSYYSILGVYFFTKKINFFLRKEIMVKSFLALLLISFDRGFNLSSAQFYSLFHISFSEASYLARLLSIVIPPILCSCILWQLRNRYDQQAASFYGLTLRGITIRPYFLLLAGMIPLLAIASFHPDFTAQYPFFKYWHTEPAFGLSPKQLFSLYEFFYLVNFINIELLFRGLLVIGMMRLMNTEAVLPMVVCYAFIHFGKPVPETISSVAGGYILGILSYKSQHITGGILLHIAIAFLMDLFALWQIFSHA